ncbi:MAG: hypothetical protein ACRENC_10210 [Gemmatimonadaceae bacterium]
MKHIGRRYVPGTRRLRAGLILCGAVGMLGGCRKQHVRTVGPPPATKISIPDSLRKVILAAAANTYFDSSSGHAGTITLPGHRSSTTIAPDSGGRDLSRDSLAHGAVVARISSQEPFRPLGIDRGHTFVWMDSVSGGRTLMVPETANHDVYEMATALGSHVISESVPSSAHWFADTMSVPGDAPTLYYYFNSRCNNTCCISPAPSQIDFARVDSAFKTMLGP